MGEREQTIKRAVRERYAAVARGVERCCGPSTAALDLYEAGQVEGLPSEVLAASAGCGSPTALERLRPGETLLDLGSGGGIDCFLAARAVGPQGRVIGVDMTPEMVGLATRNARRLGLDNVAFLTSEMERVPLADATVDVVISNCVINLAPDKGAVFREAFRVLRPGGRLLVSDTALAGPLPPEVREDLGRWTECVAGALPLEEYLETVRGAGFVEVEVVSRRPMRSCDDAAVGSVLSVEVRARRPLGRAP